MTSLKPVTVIKARRAGNLFASMGRCGRCMDAVSQSAHRQPHLFACTFLASSLACGSPPHSPQGGNSARILSTRLFLCGGGPRGRDARDGCAYPIPHLIPLPPFPLPRRADIAKELQTTRAFPSGKALFGRDGHQGPPPWEFALDNSFLQPFPPPCRGQATRTATYYPPPPAKVSPGQNKAGNANAPSAGIPF